jgi:TatD DNase family protein
MLIDSHCHLEKFHAAGELDAVLQRAREAGVGRCITVGTKLADWHVYATLAREHPQQVDWTAGLHPCSVDESWEDQVQALASFFATAPCPVALGEIGLDYFHLPRDPAAAAAQQRIQQLAFEHQLQLAWQLDCPVVVHSRGAFAACVEAIDASGIDWRKVVFHCFAGDVAGMRMLRARGGRGSFTGIVTYRNAADVRAALAEQGAGVLMVETDAPYLAPEPHRGKRCEPAHVRLTAEACAAGLGLAVDALLPQLHENTVAFFGLAG